MFSLVPLLLIDEQLLQSTKSANTKVVNFQIDLTSFCHPTDLAAKHILQMHRVSLHKRVSQYKNSAMSCRAVNFYSVLYISPTLGIILNRYLRFS